MQTVIWAFGSMLVFLLIFSVIPLSYTLKGKVIVGITGFVLALVGNAAAASFPIWLTFLMMAALAFFASFITENRFATVLYKNGDHYHFEEGNFKTDSLPISNIKVEDNSDIESLDLIELGVLTPTPSQSENLKTQASPSYMGKEIAPEFDEEDISFLQVRGAEEEVVEVIEELNIDGGYLSEIESLLQKEFEKHTDTVEEGWLDELTEFSNEKIKGEKSNADSLLEDLELESYLLAEEVAVGKEDNHNEVISIKKLELQKLN
ncbi:hypothetical protein ABC255_07250 [Neobacillus sp. 3P2-tot-E-2]|uniref:hypothetical protein n=1 Tax=Neobacillus sp. 3P2-tot-E-2 TaxID=3132212 RepID=UPI0039A2B1D7